MTDAPIPAGVGGGSGRAGLHTDDEARKRLNKRYASEARFKWIGLGAVLLAGLFLVMLLSTILTQAFPAFRANSMVLPVDLTASKIDPANQSNSAYDTVVREALSAEFPEVTDRRGRRALRGLMSSGSGVLLAREVQSNPDMLGAVRDHAIPLDDFADLYMKGLLADEQQQFAAGNLVSISGNSGEVDLEISGSAVLDQARTLAGAPNDATSISLTSGMSSFLLETGGGTVKLTDVSAAENGNTEASGLVLTPLATEAPGAATLRVIVQPEAQRKITDREIVWLDKLDENGKIESRWNWLFFSTGASREPEMAGIWGAVVGSFLTMVVTLVLSFPIGVAAAIYLEEFAPKNRWTQLIEVNINNLAAVPSIVFGLLGLAVFLNWFALPRSAPLVGGMVLALMTLPTIIIASRAALRAVPPSIREAALGIGASRIQTVFHHVLPLAMPGILTGTIIGMAQALGETAPLLMIGMVAFIVDIPGGFTDPATVLPVQIFMWADFPEPAFQQKTAAAIMILLGFLIIMNAIAVILRKRFERRW